jgi:biotin carboxyl carrier protein
MLIGYARVSAQEQDLSAQTTALRALGVDADRIHVDREIGDPDRPGLRAALSVCRPGDCLVVTALDRLARTLPEAHDVAQEVMSAGAALSIGGTVYEPDGPTGRLLSTVLAMVADFEPDLTRARGREKADPRDPRHVAVPFSGVVHALVAEGDTVEAGQAVATIEAMKMEASITSANAGTVAHLAIADMRQAEGGDLLLVLE